MRALRVSAPRLLLSILLVFSLNIHSGTAFAQTEGNTQEPTTTQPSDQIPDASSSSLPTGPVSPTGADASSYVYNEATGKWENDYYIWDPATHQTSPKTQQAYSYNPDTNMWDTTEWVYDAPSGTYLPNVQSVPENPEQPASSADTDVPAQPSLAGLTTSQATNTGPASTSQTQSNTSTSGMFDLYYNANISNSIQSTARSGNILIGQNTSAGNGTSGDALNAATVLNLLQSAWNPNNGDFTTFTADINGDVTGDIVIDPGQLPSQNLAVKNQANSLDINAYSNLDVENTIDLSAQSGDVALDSNTQVGDGTSGDAVAMANVLNLINSAISSGDSFIGTVNINGTLDGDILFPPGFLEQVLAQNGASTSSNTASAYDVDISNTSSIDIANNVNAQADSGTVSADGNTSVGSLQSGDSDTSVTILNMTGRQVIGENALLVFVNVLGKWVGMIMDAPGTSSALIGGNTTHNALAGTQDISIEDRIKLTNTVNVGAESGDVDITNNTEAGNGTSGDASAIVNIANIANSQFSFSRWFGVLFINIFGSWTGSFGVDTLAGDPVLPNNPTPNTNSSTGSSQPVKVFRLVTNTTQNNTAPYSAAGTQSSPKDDPKAKEDMTAVLAATDQQPPSATQAEGSREWVPAVALIVLVSIAIGGVLRTITLAVIRRRTA